jgi:hypothetical protein
MMISKRFLYFFFLAWIVSCNSTSSFTEINPELIENKESTSSFVGQKMNVIDSYISKIDFKANDFEKFNIEVLDELVIQGNKRIITTNESDKNIVLKNKSIVRVKYKDHLHNNFIKSKVFYYDNDDLICIKVYEIMPNNFNKAALYQRTIYVYNDQPIADSDKLNQANSAQHLVTLGHEYLKNEYLSLN